MAIGVPPIGTLQQSHRGRDDVWLPPGRIKLKRNAIISAAPGNTSRRHCKHPETSVPFRGDAHPPAGKAASPRKRRRGPSGSLEPGEEARERHSAPSPRTQVELYHEPLPPPRPEGGGEAAEGRLGVQACRQTLGPVRDVQFSDHLLRTMPGTCKQQVLNTCLLSGIEGPCAVGMCFS